VSLVNKDLYYYFYVVLVMMARGVVVCGGGWPTLLASFLTPSHPHLYTLFFLINSEKAVALYIALLQCFLILNAT
jgi:hypothetical protein